jgi:hypothetical protein
MASSFFKSFTMDTKVEKEGLHLDFGKNSKGEKITVRIARAGGSNVRFNKSLELKSKPYRRQIQNETLDEEVAQEIQREVYADAVVVSWENMESPDGTPLPFSRSACLQMFTEFPEFFTEVREAANKAALYRAEVQEQEAKNSERSSSTP